MSSEGDMNAKLPMKWDENVDLMIVDDGEEWNAVTEAFNRHYPDRAGLPFDLANYSRAEIDAVMVEFEPKKSSRSSVHPVPPEKSA
jgi:hypothetical protein